MMKLQTELQLNLLNVFLVLSIFFLTRSAFTSAFALLFTIVSLLVFISYYIYKKKQSGPNVDKTLAVLGVVTVLFLVGTTGWFYSPFFFSLYLIGLLLAFMFSPVTAFVFIVTLIGIFSFNLGDVDLVYDALVILSLLTVIPLSYYLRKEYLHLQETAKEILILEKEKKDYKNKVEEVLSNAVTNLVVNLRQPVNDTRMIALRLEKAKNQEEIDQNKERLVKSSEDALRQLDKFEKEVTGEGLVRRIV